MRNVALFSILLLLGLVASQAIGIDAIAGGQLRTAIRLATMVALAFIMIHVGFEFEIDTARISKYSWDCFVAFCAAALPWIYCSCYFAIFLPSHSGHGRFSSAILEGLFAAPTSAGVLFSMLAAAGLKQTWVFGKARVLAIFDDLHTVVLLLPVQAMIIGLRWQLAAVAIIVLALLVVAGKWLRSIRLPSSWPWVIGYSAALVAISESISHLTARIDPSMPLHIEVLLPAFVLGCIIKAHHHAEEESKIETCVATIVSAVFMVLVGLSMPRVIGDAANAQTNWPMIGVHVLAITVLSNLGKLLPAVCYRTEATRRERLALAIGMFPRGEVGAGVLVIALSYGLAGDSMTVAVLSLALNLICTGLFIFAVKRLLVSADVQRD